MKPPKGIDSHRSRLNAASLALLCFLLVIPGYALSRLASQLDWRILTGAWLALSAFAFFAYRSDKRSAQSGEWRVPEITLHLIALSGGWPGAFLAQRMFRHKTAKVSFQIVFWTILLMHQLAAIDSLIAWRYTKDLIRAIKASVA